MFVATAHCGDSRFGVVPLQDADPWLKYSQPGSTPFRNVPSIVPTSASFACAIAVANHPAWKVQKPPWYCVAVNPDDP